MACSVAEVYIVLEEHTCIDRIVRSCTSSVASCFDLEAKAKYEHQKIHF